MVPFRMVPLLILVVLMPHGQARDVVQALYTVCAMLRLGRYSFRDCYAPSLNQHLRSEWFNYGAVKSVLLCQIHVGFCVV